MTIKYYEGDRLYLRPIEPADEPTLRRWVNDPRIWRTLDRFLPINELREHEFIEKQYTSREDVAFCIVVKDGDSLIGCAGLNGISLPNQCATYGILIGEIEFQSRGFGTEATRLILKLGFEEYNLNRIELSVYESNTGAIRAYERTGFVHEGTSRQAYFRNGRYHDVRRYAILRSDWLSNTKAIDVPEIEAVETGVAT